MKSIHYLVAAGLAASFQLAAISANAAPGWVLGAPAKAAAKAAKSDPPPPEISKKVKLSPDGIKFGLILEELSKLYEKVLDKEFADLYANVEPGPRMNELDAELADKKRLILRNKLEFGSIPSGLDGTPLGAEYSYNNGEYMTQIKLRSGIQRYFFFIGNRLWKIYDVHKLGPKSKLGADYDAVVSNLTTQFGHAPRVRKATYDQADWADKETVIRVVNQGDGSIGLVYADKKTERDIDKLRPNKPKAQRVDSDVTDVTRGGGAPEAAPPAKKK